MTILQFLLDLLPSAEAIGGLTNVLQSVGGDAPKAASFCFGTGCFEGMAVKLVAEISPIALTIGAISITIAGIRLLTISSEDELSNARRTILTVFFGIVLTVLSAEGILFTAATELDNGEGAKLLCTEFIGIVSIIEGIAGFLAIIAIAIAGIKAILSFGGEDAWSSMRTVLGAVLFGVFLLTAKKAVFPAIGLSTSFGECVLAKTISPVDAIAAVLTIVNNILFYLQAAAILILVILGILLIVNLGNEEQLNKLKSYIFRLAIGFIVISLSRLILVFVLL